MATADVASSLLCHFSRVQNRKGYRRLFYAHSFRSLSRSLRCPTKQLVKASSREGPANNHSTLLPLTVPEEAPSFTLQTCLSNVAQALGLHHYLPGQNILVSGFQILYEMKGDWRFTWSVDGCFHEVFDGIEMTLERAFDGIDNAWQADSGGRVSQIDLDEKEACVLGSWVRSGFWLTKEGRSKLTFRLMEIQGLPTKDRGFPSELQVWIGILNKKVEACVTIDTITWLPIKMDIPCQGSTDRWEFSNWNSILDGQGCKFAMSTTEYPVSGGKNLFIANSVVVSEEAKEGKLSNSLYTFPLHSVVPRYNNFFPHSCVDQKCNSSVKMIQATSGHYLVKPFINSQDLGYFVVDTGASGFIISPKKANELGMDSFGTVFARGVEGPFRSCFRRGKSFQLGPLIIESPIFLESPTDTVMDGISISVSGICGFDVFHNCVIEMSHSESRLSLFDTSKYELPQNSVKWEKIYMLDNVPLVEARIQGQKTLFLLDTGAGGVDIIFHERAVNELKLLGKLQNVGEARVNGLSNSETVIKVKYGVLDDLDFAGKHFENVNVLCFGNDSDSLDLSLYTSGLLCGNLLVNYTAIFDYSRQRFALCKR